MSFWERKITLPPNSRIPTSKLTRVLVDGLPKIIAQVCPSRGSRDRSPRVFLKSREDCRSAVRSAAVWASMERKCSMKSDKGSEKAVQSFSHVGQGGGQNGYSLV